MSMSFKVESGIQLLTRLMKKQGIENFYPILFEKGPKQGDVIELFSDISTSSLLFDVISELLLPVGLGGVEASILIFSTDGNFSFEIFIHYFKKKLVTCMEKNKPALIKCDIHNLDSVIDMALKQIFLIDIFDISQFYITLQNLENILIKHSNISLVIFDTLTAFYWSEQIYKITKMDLYIKSLLRIIQRVTKDYKVTVLYMRPQYFSSSKEEIENLEPCSELQTFEQLNYRIHMVQVGDVIYDVVVRTHDKQVKRQFILTDGLITWL